MSEEESLGARMQAASMSIIVYLSEEGFTIPEGAAVLSMSMATACHEFGMPEREVVAKVEMTVKKMYASLNKLRGQKNNVKTNS